MLYKKNINKMQAIVIVNLYSKMYQMNLNKLKSIEPGT